MSPTRALEYGKKAWTPTFLWLLVGTFHEFVVRNIERGEPWLCGAANMSRKVRKGYIPL
jgi:hypothetical protein